jgi:hypothetical protein
MKGIYTDTTIYQIRDNDTMEIVFEGDLQECGNYFDNHKDDNIEKVEN